MGTADTNNIWEKIQHGVMETKHLLERKQYNLSMIKARQTLEFMVNCLAEKACIIDGELMDTIDQLNEGNWISKSTCDHYHKIRMIGNKAVHEGNANPTYATQSYQFLLEEAELFAEQFLPKRRKSSGDSQAHSSASRSSASRSATSRSTASRSTASHSANRSRKRPSKRRRTGTGSPYYLLKLLIPVVCIVLLVAVIKIIVPGKKTTVETSTAQITTEATMAPTTEAPTEAPTLPEPTTEAVPVPLLYKTTTNLNVRKEPSTNSQSLGLLTANTQVEYIKQHDDKWAVIKYNDQEAYVAHQYLTKVE